MRRYIGTDVAIFVTFYKSIISCCYTCR